MTRPQRGPGRPRGQLGGRVRRVVAQLGRRLVRPVAAVVVVVVLVRCWLGVWPTAVLVATAGTVGLLAGWAAIDRRLFAPRWTPRARLVERGPRASGRQLDAADHAAFARALAAVAGAYLTECERHEAREAQP